MARQKVAGTPKGFRITSRGCAAGATPGRRICLKCSPVRAAQTPDAAGFCATLSGLSPKGVPTRGRRDARQPRAVLRSPFRAFPNGNPQVGLFAKPSVKMPRQKVAGTPKGFRITARGCAAGATPGRRICLKPSPERAAQTPGMAGLCATLSGLLPTGVPTRGRREARQPRAVLRSPFRAFPNGNPQVCDFLPDRQQWGYGKKSEPPSLPWKRRGVRLFRAGRHAGPGAAAPVMQQPAKFGGFFRHAGR